MRPKKPNGLSILPGPLDKETQIFYCSYPDCGYRNNRKVHVALHEKRHHNPVTQWHIPCQVCSQFFGSLVSFLHHMSSKHLDKLFCTWCLFLGKDLTEFKAHIAAHSLAFKSSGQNSSKGATEFGSDACSTSYAPKEDLSRHGNSTPNPSTPSAKEVQAEILNKIQQPSENSGQMGEYYQREESSCPSDPSPAVFGSVEAPTGSKSSLEEIAGVRREFRCGECSINFKLKWDLERHKIEICSNSFNSVRKSAQKIEADAQEDVHSFKAEKSSREKSSRVRREFRCGTCCSSFTPKANPSRQQKKICNSSNSAPKSALRIQPETTEDNIPKSFEDAQFVKLAEETPSCPQVIPPRIKICHEIQSGMEKLNGEKEEQDHGVEKVVKIQRALFGCNNCSFKTAYVRNLHLHHRIHTGERPFNCPNIGCDYKARWVQNLRRHLRSCQSRRIKSEATSMSTKDNLRSDTKSGKITQVNMESWSSSMAFACMLCDFIGDSELSALKHARQHKTVAICLSRID